MCRTNGQNPLVCRNSIAGIVIYLKINNKWKCMRAVWLSAYSVSHDWHSNYWLWTDFVGILSIFPINLIHSYRRWILDIKWRYQLNLLLMAVYPNVRGKLFQNKSPWFFFAPAARNSASLPKIHETQPVLDNFYLIVFNFRCLSVRYTQFTCVYALVTIYKWQ